MSSEANPTNSQHRIIIEKNTHRIETEQQKQEHT